MPESKIQATTQEHLDIEDIRDDLLILKNGNVVLVLQTNAVNFDLLSEEEQDSMIFAYSQLLNSLSFPIQVLIRSKIMDISNYLVRLREAKAKQEGRALVAQMELYENFIKELVAKNNVLDKRFYVVIPHIEVSLNSLNPLSNLGSKRVVFDKWGALEKAKLSLAPKKEHLIKQLNRIGVKSKQLTTQELVELFYDIYSPTVVREQKVALSSSEYTTPLVEPAIETAFVSTPSLPPQPQSQSGPPQSADGSRAAAAPTQTSSSALPTQPVPASTPKTPAAPPPNEVPTSTTIYPPPPSNLSPTTSNVVTPASSVPVPSSTLLPSDKGVSNVPQGSQTSPKEEISNGLV